MIRRVLRFDTIEGYWRMDEQQYEEMNTDNAVDDWHRAKNSQIVGAVLAESEQIQSRKAHIKRERRKRYLITALLVVGVIIVWGAVFASALAVR